MQRGAGGSQCLCTDDCSVTLINREEQVALRQAAGRPPLLPPTPGTGARAFASPAVPLRRYLGTSPCPSVLSAGREWSSGGCRAPKRGCTALRGCWWHLPLPVPWCMWLCRAKAGPGEHRLAPRLGLCLRSQRCGWAALVPQSCCFIKSGRVSLAAGWFRNTRS